MPQFILTIHIVIISCLVIKCNKIVAQAGFWAKPDQEETEMSVLVKNATGGTYNPDVPAGYDSWLDYWQKHKYITSLCRCCGKYVSQGELVGGHVVAPGYSGVYIAPLCKECNNPNNTKMFSVEETDLVQVH